MALNAVFRQSAGTVLVAIVVAASGISMFGQTSTTPVASGATASQTAHAAAAKSRARKRVKKAEPPPPVQEIKPVEPPPPDWPMNAQAQPATVGWDGRDLKIAATNSSLQQILRDVTVATGVKVDGLNADQRIFGSYGPADARDVLAQLLDGSGYNVLMIGEQKPGTPRQVVLTVKSHNAAGPVGQPGAAAQSQNSDDEVDEQPEPPEQPEQIQRRPVGGAPQPGMPPRTPQQMMQELQQRQQQMQQQPGSAPNQPNQPN